MLVQDLYQDPFHRLAQPHGRSRSFQDHQRRAKGVLLIQSLNMSLMKRQSFVDNKTDSGKPAVRFFCGNCSSTIYSRPEWIAGSLIVKVGTLDESDKVKT